eukprot:5023120-Amphidinium_carterae.1
METRAILPNQCRLPQALQGIQNVTFVGDVYLVTSSCALARHQARRCALFRPAVCYWVAAHMVGSTAGVFARAPRAAGGSESCTGPIVSVCFAWTDVFGPFV